MQNRQEILTKELNEANIAYRNSGISLMSDREYDEKLEELKKLEAESGIKLAGSPTDLVGAEAVDFLEKAKHESPALSLDKVKYKDKEDLIKWLGDKQGIISWKNDGLTVVLTFDNGTLTSAVTRGNGEEGNIITHNARFFKGIPQTIPFKGHLVLRGEAMMTYAEFERINVEAGGIYENPRNLASATIQMLDANESRKREIIFRAFELVSPAPTVSLDEKGDIEATGMDAHRIKFMMDRLDWLQKLGFSVVDREMINADNILDTIEKWKKDIPNLTFPTDGLVISYNDMVYGMSLGNTGHHFRHSIALKWSDETVTTTIRDIEFSVGKTGIITPVAVFDEVRLGLGSNVTRASLHNLSIMERLGVKKGCKAEVYLANLIIPAVAETDGHGEDFVYPDKCPVCGQPTRIYEENGVKTLHCENKDCAAQQIGKFMNTFGKDGLFVKGLGESQIQDLLNYELVSNALDFYTLRKRTEEDAEAQHSLAHMLSNDGWGPKKWNNLLDAIDASRETTLQKFLYSLNIPLLGNDLSKKLSKYWNGYIGNFVSFIGRADTVNGYKKEILVEELTAIDGIGEEKATNIANWAAEMIETGKWKDEIEPLIYTELIFPEKEDVKSADNTLEGLTFVITGAVHNYKNRDEFKASVEARGGKVAGSISAKSNYLVNNDLESTSGKNKKAKELNVPIISEDEFIQKFGR